MTRRHAETTNRAQSLPLLVGLAVVGIQSLAAEGVNSTRKKGAPSRDEASAGQQEYRRRGGVCMNSRVYAPAKKEARLPRDIGRIPVINPRIRSRHGKILCYAVAGDTLWAADDESLYEVSCTGTKLTKRFGWSDGLPDEAIQSIAPAGEHVWLATLAGLARLDSRSGTVRTVPGIKFTIAHLALGPDCVWLVSDAGAYRLARNQEKWEKLPEFPGRKRLASVVRAGFWWFRWRDKEVRPLGPVFANEHGLYVLHETQLWHYDLRTGKWLSIAKQAWQVVPQDRNIWVMCTDGVLCYSPEGGEARKIEYGKGPAAGRATAMTATGRALYLASYGITNMKSRKFTGFKGGGISRLDLATRKWQITNEIDGIPVHFADALIADGEEVWASVMLYDKAEHRSAHPGMAHVKRWMPHPNGIGLAHYRHGKWTMIQFPGLRTEKRWIGPQGNKLYLDSMGPQNIQMLCCTEGRVWGVYKMFPEHWFGGYYISAGCLARRHGDRWRKAFNVQTRDLELLGEHPALLGLSRSHGEVYLAEGHFSILGLENVGDRCWVISQGGVYAQDAHTGRFGAVVSENDLVYFRATAAAPGKDAVWFGGDGGTISRLDRTTGWLELVGVVPGREITAIAFDPSRASGSFKTPNDQGRVLVRTAKTRVTLPFSMRSAKRLPDADTLVFDGKKWRTGSQDVRPVETRFSCKYAGPHRDKGKYQPNYLYRAGQKIAFLRGVFRPNVLCEDPVGKKLWLATYSGPASIPLPTAASEFKVTNTGKEQHP